MGTFPPQAVHYQDYLKLDSILQAQDILGKNPEVRGEEHLFIITHQTYELWFKQVLLEAEAIASTFTKDQVDEREMGKVHSKLERINKIMNLLLEQLTVLETMTPMDFLEFREALSPASGFQSLQFRLLEVKLGLKVMDRPKPIRDFFIKSMKPEDLKVLLKVEEQPSLLSLIDKWLARFPFLQWKDFDFKASYAHAIHEMCKVEIDQLEGNPFLTDEQRSTMTQHARTNFAHFEAILDQGTYDQWLKEGKKKIGQQAALSALFIMLYREEPLLTLPFKIITAIMDFDETLTRWRHRHALMAHRMLGQKLGTGGSTGHQYLSSTTSYGRVFQDFFDLSSQLIPRHLLPKLPGGLKEKFHFHQGL